MKVNVPAGVFFWAGAKTLAMIAGDHRGSGIYTWIRGLKGEDMRAITSAGLSFCERIHQQGSGRDRSSLVRVISLTSKDIRGQIVAASTMQRRWKWRKSLICAINFLIFLFSRWKKLTSVPPTQNICRAFSGQVRWKPPEHCGRKHNYTGFSTVLRQIWRCLKNPNCFQFQK